jgi:16S rRNA (cytidine1402-2'-O)-methyltransferase
MDGTTGVLYLVSTPIGNLEDITLRALRILKEVDLVACEDTRRSKRLLSHYGISKPLISYYSPKEAQRVPLLLDRLKKGERVALITDAGTPLLSDPGWRLVKEAIEEGVPLVPVPGPSALLAALVASGFPTHPFAFWGFPPRKKGELLSFLKGIKGMGFTHVFFESPKRLLGTLKVMEEVWGGRRVVVAREMTKIYEEFIRGRLGEVRASLGSRKEVKGEAVLLVEGGEEEEPWKNRAWVLAEEGFSAKEVAKILKVLYGISKREVYSLLGRGDLDSGQI